MTIQSTLKIHSLVEKVEVLQVPFTLCLRDQWSKWMHNGCKVYLDYFQKPSLRYGPNTKLRNHCTLKSHKHWFLIFYHVWGHHMNKNSLKWNLIEGLVPFAFTLHLRARDQTTSFWKWLGTAFGHFFWAPTITWLKALGSSVKWP